jgi:hypothetical protein
VIRVVNKYQMAKHFVRSITDMSFAYPRVGPQWAARRLLTGLRPAGAFAQPVVDRQLARDDVISCLLTRPTGRTFGLTGSEIRGMPEGKATADCSVSRRLSSPWVARRGPWRADNPASDVALRDRRSGRRTAPRATETGPRSAYRRVRVAITR